MWSPDLQTIFYDPTSSNVAKLLHELSHGLLQHTSYKRDIQLLEMERDAWQHASGTLAPMFSINISSYEVEDSLDSYRDWLHARSTCPGCQAIGLQSQEHEYRCIACNTRWKVNEARICALRRYVVRK